MNESLIEKVDDLAMIKDFLWQVSHNLEDGKPMPDHVPELHDGVVSDWLSNIAGHITMMKKCML